MRGACFKQVTLVVGVVFCLTVFFIAPLRIGAETVEELQQRLEQKNEEIKKLEEEAKKYRDEVFYSQNRGKTLKEELARVEKVIQQFKKEISLTEKKLERATLEVGELNINIRSREVAIKKMRSGLGALVQAVSERDQENLVRLLVHEGFVSDFFHRLDQFSLVEEKILESLGKLRELKTELEIQKARAEDKKDELQNLQGSLKDQKKIQDLVRQDKTKVVTITKNQEKYYQELLRETERKQEEILKDIEELEEKLREQVDPGSLPERRKGFLQWPAEGLLSQGYGETPFTKSKAGRHFYKFHNGIDISASMGTPILAAYDGTILAIGDTDKYCYRGAYGKYIVVDHQNNLATMYAHLSLVKVERGQTVKNGDIIGYMGSTGLSTGPHLHFTLYDARTVEIRKGTVGTCGLLPFGGSLNPLLYL